MKEKIFAVNHTGEGPPEKLSPILAARLAALGADPQHPSGVGDHAEVHALNAALLKREETLGRPLTNDDLGRMMLDTAWTRESGKGNMVPLEPAPQCGNCAPVTAGVVSLVDNASLKPKPW